MLQDLETTIEKLVERRKELEAADSLAPRLHETILTYASEVSRDLKEKEWTSQFYGGLNAGYILCLMGETSRGIEYFDKSFQLHQKNKDGYDDPKSTALRFVVETLEEFGADQSVIAGYRSRLEKALERERKKPEDLKRNIVHIEADMECTTGDLNQTYSHGRREQGLLHQKLGEHEEAIARFRQSMEEDRRDWRSETSINNALSIADSCLALGENAAAADEFMQLMKKLVPGELAFGDEIPDLFVENYSRFAPYMEKLGMSESMENVAAYAWARVDKLKGMIKPPTPKEGHKEHGKRSELCRLSTILASHHASKGEYKQASDIYDEGRELLEYKNHLSRRDQAEFAIRAGDMTKARQLISEDEAERDSLAMDRDVKTYELTNLHLQLGDVTSALNRLDESCASHKASRVSGSYSDIFDTRRTQIAVYKAVMGDDYFQNAREYQAGRADLLPNNGLKFLPEKNGS